MDAIVRVIFEKVGILYVCMVIFITSAAVIFLPPNLLEQLMLKQIRADYGRFFGPAFILSGAYLTVAFIGKIITSINDWKNRRKYKRIVLEKIENLTSDDMSILCEFYDEDTETLRETAYLDYYDRRVKLLEGYGIITRLASSGIATMTRDGNMSCPMPFELHFLARKHLNESLQREIETDNL